jgi:MFS family permease
MCRDVTVRGVGSLPGHSSLRATEDLGLDSSGAQWMNAIYSLVFASLMLTVGRFGDLYGRKRLFTMGLVLFMAASLFAGASVNPAMLIGSRLVQGLGAAMVLPSTLSTLNAMFQGRERGIAFAIWGSTIGGMAAVGPLAGGWLATDVSWRWAFWLNIPFGLLALGGISRYIDETRDTTLRRGADVPGVLLSSLGLAGIVFGRIEGQYYGWWQRGSGAASPVPFALVGGVALVAAFVVVEQRRVLAGKVALVDLGLLRIRSFRFGIIAALIVALGALSTTVPGVVIAAWLFVYGVGVGMATAQLTSVILVEVPVADVTSQTTARLADSDLTPAQRERRRARAAKA